MSLLRAAPALALFCGCQAILGLEPRTYADPDGGQCRTNADCAGFNVENPDSAYVCVKAKGICAPLKSAHCRQLVGDWQNDQAILITSLMTLQGAQAGTNSARNNAGLLAVEEINRAGGVPWPERNRPLVHLTCDATKLAEVGEHLVKTLAVPVIIGPTNSQDVIDFTTSFSAQGGTMLISPSSLAGSISDLPDNDLTFRSIPSDVQRAPLLAQRINDLEAMLRQQGVGQVKLAIIARRDSLGSGTMTALKDVLRLNGERITAQVMTNVLLEEYDPAAPNQQLAISRVTAHRPHIVVGAGTAEVVTQVVGPMEASWGPGPRPYYVFIDSVKTNELINTVHANDAGMRERTSGTGISPVPESVNIEQDFGFSYASFFAPKDGGVGTYPAFSGMGPSYDTVYALALTIASQPDLPITGHNLATGIRRLTAGSDRFEVGPRDLGEAFKKVANKGRIWLQGTYGPMELDDKGDIVGSQIEVWCISKVQPGRLPVYSNSGQTFNTKTKMYAGAFTPCQ